MNTTLETSYPINRALIEAVKYLNAKHSPEKFKTVCVNDKQDAFMKTLYQPRNLELFSPTELRSKVSVFVSEINAWLKENNYDIQLQETYDPNGFAVGSIFEVATNWLREGKETTLTVENNSCKAFSLEPHYEKRSVYDIEIPTFDAVSLADYTNPAIRFTTKNGDSVCLLEVDQSKDIKTPTEMYSFVKSSENGKFRGLSKIVLPELDLNLQPDISWFCKMQFISDHNFYYISEALQQIKFKMNKVGAEVKSAVAMSIMTGSLSIGPRYSTWYFDKPFYMWMTRPGTTQPYFSAFIGTESFIKV